MSQKKSNEEEYISLTKATEYCDYSQEYLSLRARQGKLKAEKIGRNWVITKKWVEEYFGMTNSSQAREQEKKANGFSSSSSFSYDKYFSAFARALGEVGETIKKSKIIFSKPELRYAIASVLVFIFLSAGFVWAGPTLSVAKDLFVEGLAVFSEETSKGISNFSRDAYSLSDIAREVVKVPFVPSVSIPTINIPPAPRMSSVSIMSVSDKAYDNFQATRAKALASWQGASAQVCDARESFVNFSFVIGKNFPSAKSGASGVVQNFRDGKDFVIDGFSRARQTIEEGVENTAIAIINIPAKVADKIVISDFQISDFEESPKLHIRKPEIRKSEIRYQEIKYGLGYTGEMVTEYTQWLNQTFVKQPMHTANTAKKNFVEGISIAKQNFSTGISIVEGNAFNMENPFCSLGESFGERKLGIVNRDILGEMFPNLKSYKEFAYDALLVRNIREILAKSILE